MVLETCVSFRPRRKHECRPHSTLLRIFRLDKLIIKDQPDWSCVIEEMLRKVAVKKPTLCIQMKMRMLEMSCWKTRKKSELDTNSSADAITTQASNNEQDSSNGDPYTDPSHEGDDSEHNRFISPTSCLPEDPFANENVIITNVPL
ncbi:13368_t:CDS:2, partial [Dentiscutata erythropus]